VSKAGFDDHLVTITKTLEFEVNMLERNNGVALWRQIEQVLTEEIETGDLEAGSRLPTEPTLAERFKVNRHTVRRAVSGLVERGLVKVEQGRGSFVAEHVLDYFIGRHTRFSDLVHKQNRHPGGTLLFTRRIKADAVVAEALMLAPGADVHMLETVGELDGRPISVGSHYFPAERFPDLDEVHDREGSITRTLTHYGCGDYERRITKVTARMPDGSDAELLRQARGRPILVTESVNVDSSDIPVEYGVARFAADRFQIVFET
jgi:GntR family transcriptional regulator, phosphonate transport system regulatory protein